MIVPLFQYNKLNAEWVSKLTPLTTAWCVAENIMLAAITIGGNLAGPTGMLLGVPAAASAYALLKEATAKREASMCSKEANTPAPACK